MPLNFRILILLILISTQIAGAQSKREELQAQIDSRGQDIQALENEIKALQGNLTNTTKQTTTLKSEVARLDTISKKLSADIRLTESKISQTALKIEQLELDIDRKQGDISASQAGLGEAMRALRESDDQTLVEAVLAGRNLSDFWTERERLVQLEGKINEAISELKTAHQELKVDKGVTEKERGQLITLKAKLADQKKINDGLKSDQADLLSQTKSQESSYRSLLTDRQTKKEAFETEIATFEAALKLDVDLSKLPGLG